MNPLNDVIVNDLDLYSHQEEGDDYLSWSDCKALEDYRHYYIRNATAMDIKQQCCFCVMNNIKKGDKIVRSRGQGGSSDFFRTYHIECMANMLEQMYVNMKDSLEEMKTLYKVEATPYKLTRDYINAQCRSNIVKQINERLNELEVYNYVEWLGDRFIVHQHGHEFTPKVDGLDDCNCKVVTVHVWKSILSNAYTYSSTRTNLYGEQQQIDQDMFVEAIEKDVEHPQKFSERYSFVMESIMEAIRRINLDNAK